MSVGIVDALEVIQIGHRDPDREIVARRSAQFVRSPDINCTAVRQTGERVGQGHLFQLTILGLQLVMEIGNTTAHFHAGMQFSRMERLGEIVIGSRG